MLEKQNRWKSKVLWVTITSAIIALIGNLGLYDVIGIEKTAIESVVNVILTILVSFGILNNPTDSENL